MAEDKKITKAVDKLVMGMIIGGAVGSVLGMAFSPKSGKENRKLVKNKVEDIKEMASGAKDDFVREHKKEITSVKKGLFAFMTKTFHPKKKRNSHE